MPEPKPSEVYHDHKMTGFILSWNLPELVNCFVPVGHKAAALRGCQMDFYQPLLVRLE